MRHLIQNLFLSLVLFSITLCAGATEAQAQSFLHAPAPSNEMSLEWGKPFFTESDGLSFLTSVAHLTGRVAVRPRFLIVGSVPLSHWGVSSDFQDESATDLGNPYLGFQFYTPGEITSVSLGTRLPLASSDGEALLVGIIGDFDRFEAYMPETGTVEVELASAYHHSSGLQVEGRFRQAFLYPTGDNRADNEFYLHYEGRVWYAADPVRVGVGLAGAAILSEKDLDFSERTVHHGSVYLAADIGNLRPGAYARLPLDEEFSDGLDLIFGLGVAYTLPR